MSNLPTSTYAAAPSRRGFFWLLKHLAVCVLGAAVVGCSSAGTASEPSSASISSPPVGSSTVPSSPPAGSALSTQNAPAPSPVEATSTESAVGSGEGQTGSKEFCEQLYEIMIRTNFSSDVTEWATDINSRLNKLLLIAPPNVVADLETLRGLYEEVAASGSKDVLSDKAAEFSAAVTPVLSACGY